MKIIVTFHYENATLVSDFRRVQFLDCTFYALDFKAYSADGKLLEHNRKHVPAEYVTRRIKTCRKYHGTLTVARYCNDTFITTYRKDY